MNYFKIVLFYLFFQLSTFNGYGLNPEKKYNYSASDFSIDIADSLYLITSDGYKIFTCFFNPERSNNNKTIIISYGDAGNLSYYFQYARRLTNDGYSVVLFDYRGFGKSDDFEINKDQIFYNEFEKDLSAVINHTKSKYPQNKIVIMAFSMGTILTTLVSDTNPIDFIIAENFVTDIYAVKDRLENREQNQSTYLLPSDITNDEYLSKINKIKIPILIFSSTLDQITTLEDSHTLTKNNNCTIIPYEGNHGCGALTLSDKYFDEINSFLAKN